MVYESQSGRDRQKGLCFCCRVLVNILTIIIRTSGDYDDDDNAKNY